MNTLFKPKSIAIPIAAAALWMCSSAFAHRSVSHHAAKRIDPPIEDVSLIQLIANPEKYDGRRVRVIGFFRSEYEEHAVYLHQEDDEQGISADSVWVDLPVQTYARYHTVSGKYAIIEGTFSSQDRGEYGMSGGSIENVTRCEPWTYRSEIEALHKAKRP